MIKANVLLALFLCFYKISVWTESQKEMFYHLFLCQGMSGFSCHPEEYNPRLVIILLSVNCFLDGIMDNNVQTYRFSG